MFLADAKRLYETTRPPKIELYIFNSKKPDFWDAAPMRQKRNWDGIILHTDVKDRLRDSVREFFGSELWYAAKGVNWTMGKFEAHVQDHHELTMPSTSQAFCCMALQEQGRLPP
jgi:hypothetical protein